MFRWFTFFLLLITAGAQAQHDVLCTIVTRDSAKVRVVLTNALYRDETFDTTCYTGEVQIFTTNFHPRLSDSIPDWWDGIPYARVADSLPSWWGAVHQVHIFIVPLHMPEPLFIPAGYTPGSFDDAFEFAFEYQLRPWKSKLAEGMEPKNTFDFEAPYGFFSTIELNVEGAEKSQQVFYAECYGMSMKYAVKDVLPTDTFKCWLLFLRGENTYLDATIRVPMRSL